MKNTGLWIRTGIIIAITVAGFYLVFGPRRVPNTSDFTWQGIKNNLANNITLGLDLKGGSHLVMRVKTDDYLKKLTENNAQAALSTLQEAKLNVVSSQTVAENGSYSLSLTMADGTNTQDAPLAVKKKIAFSQ